MKSISDTQGRLNRSATLRLNPLMKVRKINRPTARLGVDEWYENQSATRAHYTGYLPKFINGFGVAG
jgi:hypothetical protein